MQEALQRKTLRYGQSNFMMEFHVVQPNISKRFDQFQSAAIVFLRLKMIMKFYRGLDIGSVLQGHIQRSLKVASTFGIGNLGWRIVVSRFQTRRVNILVEEGISSSTSLNSWSLYRELCGNEPENL